MARDLTLVPTEELLLLSSEPADEHVQAEAVAELVTRYKALVYNRALRMCAGNRALADDVFQETFLRLFSWLRNRRGRPPLHTFPHLLSTFVKRTAVDLMRKEKREVPTATFEDALSVATQEEPNWETRAYALELLEVLDSRSRKVVELSYIQGLSALEIAKVLKVTPGNVRVLRFRALEAMRARKQQDEMADLIEPL
jgi:RNA polymerase sigma-70 factor, ECF subfamily